MDYYHLTTDLDVISSASSASEANENDETEDDPNWLIINSGKFKTTQKSVNPKQEVVVRRTHDPHGSHKPRHHNRLSQIWDGVIASYYINGEGATNAKCKAFVCLLKTYCYTLVSRLKNEHI